MKARVAAMLAVFLAACGGASEGDLFAPRPSTATVPTTSDSSGDPAFREAGTSDGDASRPYADAGPDDATKPDAAKPWKSPGVYCGESSGAPSYCAVGTQICCATLQFDLGFRFACEQDKANACKSDRRLRCDDRSDCQEGQVCCAVFEAPYGYQSSECRSSCSSAGQDGGAAVRLCDLHAPKDECEKVGKKCRPSQSLDGFGICE